MTGNVAGGKAGIQAELQQYLKEKDLNVLFVSIVENILIEKPDNPIGFMAQYLIDKFPTETKEIIAKLADSSPESVPELVEIEDSDNSSDSDSDEESTAADNEKSKPHPPAPTTVNRNKRRTSICAEKLCANAMNSSEVKTIPKTEEEAARIKQILQSNVLFQHLDEEQVKTVQGAMFSVEKEEEDVIIKQGDDGDNFYIIDSGPVDVYINAGDGEPEKLVASYSDGDSFGELAIMYNAPRAATCIAKGAVRLWALDRVSFKVILMKTAISKRNEYKSFLQQVPVLSQLTEYEVLTAADALQEECFDDGAVICNQDDNGERFYIIRDGTAICTQDRNGTSLEVARLTDGAYFGEIALLTSKPRQATVTASGSLRCLTLDRRTFKRVMGPLQEILMRNIEEYNKVVAANI